MLKLVAFSSKNVSEILPLMDLGENRKRSKNMVLASEIVKELFVLANKKMEVREIDLLFCSGEGEIQQTYDFFANLNLGRARPILFQNSLHNSTLGALSLEVPHIASGITISSGDVSFESAIDTALSSPSELPVLILGVDAYNDEIGVIRQKNYGSKVELTSGGCAALFIPESHPLFNQISGPIIQDIKFETTTEEASFKNYYPANGMEIIAPLLHSGIKSFSIIRPHHHQITVITHEPS